MRYYLKSIFYRLCFFFFFIFKKKKLGFKKVQWKLSSFFHSNRIKYFVYFINKLSLYKKYIFYFYLRSNLFILFSGIRNYFSSFKLNNLSLFRTNIFFHYIEGSFYKEEKDVFASVTNCSINNLFMLFSTNIAIKLIFFMFKFNELSCFSPKIKKNKFTILRSPHIDKKSREQFELKHFNVVLNESSIFSLSHNLFLSNNFFFFIKNFKLNEKVEYIIK